MKVSSRPTLRQIKSAANILFGEDIFVKTRGKRDLARKRQCCHYVAHRLFKYSQQEVGNEFGSRDHSTVLYSCRTIENEIDSYEYISDWVHKLYQMCIQKEEPTSPVKILLDLKRSKTVDPNIKVEINMVLKLLKDEGI